LHCVYSNALISNNLFFMKKMVLVAAGLFILFAQGYTQDSSMQTTALTLKECIETALTNNLDVKTSEFAMENDKVGLQLARGQLLPTLNANIIHGNQQGRNINPYTNSYINQSVNYANYGLDGSLTLFNGLSVQNAIKQYSLNYEAGKMDVQQQHDNITINVILAYLTVLSNQDQLTLANQQAEVTRKQVERLEILNKEGATAPSNLYDMKGQLGTDELNVVTTKNALETAKLTLAQLMNVPYTEDIVLARIYDETTPVLYEGAVNDIYAQASKNLAIVKSAELYHQSAVAGIKAAKGQLYPKLYLNGGIGTNYSSAAYTQHRIDSTDGPTNGYVIVENKKIDVWAPQETYANSKISYGSQWKNNFNSYVGLTLSIPLLNGLQIKSRVKQAEITEKQTSFQEQTTKLQLKQAIEQAYVNMKAAFQTYTTVDQQVKDFEESFRAAEIKFNEGVLTSVDYLIIKSSVDKARTNLISARYNYILRSKILDYYQSKPLW
jgi:outer membrane protein